MQTLDVRENLGKADHAGQVSFAETATKLCRQFPTQCVESLFSVTRPLLFQDVRPNPPADLPLEQDQRGVDSMRQRLARRENQLPHVHQQSLRGGLGWCGRPSCECTFAFHRLVPFESIVAVVRRQSATVSNCRDIATTIRRPANGASYVPQVHPAISGNFRRPSSGSIDEGVALARGRSACAAGAPSTKWHAVA